jgi:ketosteroid isomerase-like protein
MSQENVATVRSALEAWNRRDANLWTDYAAPQVEWMPAGPASVEGTVYRGYDEVARGLDSLWQTWDEVSFEEADVRDLDEAVLWLGRLKLRGAASQVELDQEFALRFVLRDGKLARIQSFIGWRQALQAAGLTD